MRLTDVSWVKVEEYFNANDLVILATGSIESHGRHNPLGTDLLIPNKILDLIEEQCDALIVPTMPFGATDDLTSYPGTISIGPELTYQVMRSITDSLAEHGARRFIVVNGHGGNSWPLDKLSLELHRRGMWMAVFNWWITAGQLNPEWAGGHGDFEETSAIMGINPRLVDAALLSDDGVLHDVSDALPTDGFDYVRFKNATVRFFRDTRAYALNGWMGKKHPNTSSEETGKAMLQATADYITEFIGEFKKAELPPIRERGNR